MAEIDAELLERVARWCAEAGRQSGAAEIRRALSPLSWDELLAVRALLADPPPARPLGPLAVADIARGAPPDLAAEREREGRYRPEADEPGSPPGDLPAGPAPARRTRPAPRGRAASRRGPVIRRVRDAAPSPTPAAPAPAPPPIDDLLRPEGRASLERLLRQHGARRHALVAALARGWRRGDGGPPGADDLARLLDHHGLARAFERRERDELLHALRAAGGVRAAAAARLGLDAPTLSAALARLGATEEAEAIRERRRRELRGRATLAERVRLLLADDERLRDLGLVAEFEQDVARRLPEHVRALRTAGTPVVLALSRSLSIAAAEARALAARLGVALEQKELPRRPARPRGETTSPAAKPPPRRGPPAGGDTARRAAPDRGAGGARRPRPPGAKPGAGPRRPRPGGGRAPPPRRGGRR
jgi:hypothetical protein